MKKSVFTLMAVMVLSTATAFAQRGGGRGGNNGPQVEQGMNRGGQPGVARNGGRGGLRGDDMYGVAPGRGRDYRQHHGMRGGQPVVHVVNHPPRVVEHVVYPAPVPCAPVPPPPAPVPAPHPVHVTPAGVVAGAVVGTVIGALLCH